MKKSIIFVLLGIALAWLFFAIWGANMWTLNAFGTGYNVRMFIVGLLFVGIPSWILFAIIIFKWKSLHK